MAQPSRQRASNPSRSALETKAPTCFLSRTHLTPTQYTHVSRLARNRCVASTVFLQQCGKSPSNHDRRFAGEEFLDFVDAAFETLLPTRSAGPVHPPGQGFAAIQIAASRCPRRQFYSLSLPYGKVHGEMKPRPVHSDRAAVHFWNRGK